MRVVWAIVAVAGLGLGFAQADGTGYSCARGDTVRTVSVVTDTAAGRACEVQYEKTSMGAKPEVLWHADSDTAFCNKQAKTLVTRLGEAGWKCTSKAESEVADMPEPFAVAVEVGKPGDEVASAQAPKPAGVTAATPKQIDLMKMKLRPSIH